MAKTELARFIDRYTIEYVRFYPHPIERVWRAISDPAEMSVWFSRIKFDAELGGAYLALWEEPSDFKGVITAFEPPRLVRFGGPAMHGPAGFWQFELAPVEGGTRMVFVQHSEPGFWNKPEWPLDPPEPAPDTPWRPGTLGGWHAAFDELGERLDGASLPEERQRERWVELTEVYREHMRATMP